MDDINKDYLNILVKPDKEYKELIVNVKGKKYIVKIPIENVTYFRSLVNHRIEYKVEHPSPQKRGRKKIYKDRKEQNHAYYMRKNQVFL
jgi:hypothetical protein